MQYFFPEINYIHGGAEHFYTINGGNTVFNSFRVTERGKGSKVISTSDVKKEFLKKFISKPISKMHHIIANLRIAKFIAILDLQYKFCN